MKKTINVMASLFVICGIQTANAGDVGRRDSSVELECSGTLSDNQPVTVLIRKFNFPTQFVGNILVGHDDEPVKVAWFSGQNGLGFESAGQSHPRNLIGQFSVDRAGGMVIVKNLKTNEIHTAQLQCK